MEARQLKRHRGYILRWQASFAMCLIPAKWGSLLFRTRRLLSEQGIRTAFLDMTRIGSETVSLNQWYWKIILELWRSFELEINLKVWRQQVEVLAPIQQLSMFIEEVLPAFSGERLVIFIDESDSILSLSFPVNDFFAFIRSCYIQRLNNPAYGSDMEVVVR